LDDGPGAHGEPALPGKLRIELLERFGEVAALQGDQALATTCRDRAAQLSGTVAKDGQVEQDERDPARDIGNDPRDGIWKAMAFAQDGDAERAWELQRKLNPVSEEGARLPMFAPYELSAGSAGWMYLLVVEALLGVRVQQGSLALAPLLPADWDGFTLRYRHGASLYVIDVRRAEQSSLVLDGKPLDGASIALEDDGAGHHVELRVGPARPIVS
jgi:hypothetical protein